MADMATPSSSADDMKNVLIVAQIALGNAGARMRDADAAVKVAEKSLASAIAEQVAAHTHAALVNGVSEAASLAVNGSKAKVPRWVWWATAGMGASAAVLGLFYFVL